MPPKFPVQLLKHGLALCKANFDRFVESWNHVVQRSANLAGDGDDGRNGKIKIDNSDVDHPVIRFVGGSSSSTADVLPSAFQLTIVKSDGEVSGYEIKNCYSMIGGIVSYTKQTYSVTYSGSPFFIVARYYDSSGSLSLGAVTTFADLTALKNDQSRYNVYTVPLYYCDGENVIDLRTAPQVQVFENIIR
jgi:hypothetical protein